MSFTTSEVETFFSRVQEYPEVAQSWAAAQADVRFVLTGPDADLTLDRDGKLTDCVPTHVLRIAWADLEQIISGDRSFLRSLTGRRFTMSGPVMQSFAVGQALTALSVLPR